MYLEQNRVEVEAKKNQFFFLKRLFIVSFFLFFFAINIVGYRIANYYYKKKHVTIHVVNVVSSALYST